MSAKQAKKKPTGKPKPPQAKPITPKMDGEEASAYVNDVLAGKIKVTGASTRVVEKIQGLLNKGRALAQRAQQTQQQLMHLNAAQEQTTGAINEMGVLLYELREKKPEEKKDAEKGPAEPNAEPPKGG